MLPLVSVLALATAAMSDAYEPVKVWIGMEWDSEEKRGVAGRLFFDAESCRTRQRPPGKTVWLRTMRKTHRGFCPVMEFDPPAELEVMLGSQLWFFYGKTLHGEEVMAVASGSNLRQVYRSVTRTPLFKPVTLGTFAIDGPFEVDGSQAPGYTPNAERTLL